MNGQKSIFADWIFWLAVLLGGTILSFTLWYGFGFDQVIPAYAAWVWKYYHLPPYVGSWDHNFPGIFLIHRFVIQFFGESILRFRIFDFLVQLNCVLLIFYLTRLISGSSTAGLLASLFYAIYYCSLSVWWTAEKESYVFYFLLWAVFFSFYIKNHAYLRAILVGLILGFAFLVKPTFGLTWLVFGVLFLVEDIKKPLKQIWVGQGLFILSCLVPALLVILYYWRLGYLRELYEATLLFNLKVYSKVPVLINMGPADNYATTLPMAKMISFMYLIYKIMASNPLIMAAGVFMIFYSIAFLSGTKAKKPLLVLVGLIILSLLSCVIQGKGYVYYRIPFWGFLMIFAGWGWDWIARQIPGSTRFSFGGLLVVIFYLTLIGSDIAALDPVTVKYVARYWMRAWPEKGYSENMEDLFAASAYLDEHLKTREEFYYFGNFPMIPYLARRKMTSRFTNVDVFAFKAGGALTPLQIKYKKEFSDDIIRGRPRFFIIDDRGAPIFGIASFKTVFHQEFPDLVEFLKLNYHLAGKFGNENEMEVYELKN